MQNLAKAMAEAFKAIEGAVKDKTNPHYRSKYADLGNVVDAIKPALSANGLWFTQISHNIENCAAVETVIVHASGETMHCGIVSIPVSKQDAHGYGSAMTYARRYSLSAAFGVAPEDDDGNAATKATPREKPASIPSDRMNTFKTVFSALEHIDDLRALWKTMTPDEQAACGSLAKECADRLKGADDVKKSKRADTATA